MVNMLTGQDPASSENMAAVLDERPGNVVELARPRREHADMGDGSAIGSGQVTVITTPVTGAALIEGIHTAIERRERSVPWWGDGYS